MRKSSTLSRATPSFIRFNEDNKSHARPSLLLRYHHVIFRCQVFALQGAPSFEAQCFAAQHQLRGKANDDLFSHSEYARSPCLFSECGHASKSF